MPNFRVVMRASRFAAEVHRILIEPHRDGCPWAVAGAMAWGRCEKKHLARNRSGRKHPKALTEFLCFRCWGANCDAELIVPMAEVMDALDLNHGEVRRG